MKVNFDYELWFNFFSAAVTGGMLAYDTVQVDDNIQLLANTNANTMMCVN